MNDSSVHPRARSSRTSEAPTRERLLREALRLLAHGGLSGGVSLRSIVEAAGAHNTSALHYHFGNREGLIRGITEMLQEWLEPRAIKGLDRLDPKALDYSVRDVIYAVFGPVIEMQQEPTLGLDAVRFLARLGWDFGHEGQRLSADLHRRMLQRALTLLGPLLPEVGEDALKFRLILNMNNVYHGLAYRSYMWRSPFGPMSLASPENAQQLEREFVDYLEAGLRGSAPVRG